MRAKKSLNSQLLASATLGLCLTLAAPCKAQTGQTDTSGSAPAHVQQTEIDNNSQVQSQPTQERRFYEQGDHTCTIFGAGSFVTPGGEDRNNFNHGGWGFETGLGFRILGKSEWRDSLTLYLLVDYSFDKFKVRESALENTSDPTLPPGTIASAEGQFSALTFDPTLRLKHWKSAVPYFGGGFGWLHRGLSFNGASSSTIVPVSTSLGRPSTNSGVFDFGVGVNIAPKSWHGAMYFVDARVYHGSAINSGTTFAPFSIGLRW